MDTRTNDTGHERSGRRQTVSACADLIACVVEGAIARKQNIDHAQNPHFVALGDDTMTGFERNRQLCRAEAWWDGWEELNLVMRVAVAPIDESGELAIGLTPLALAGQPGRSRA